MKKSDAIAAFGSVAALARELKVTVQAVYKWPEEIPEPRAYELRGRRPDLFPHPAAPLDAQRGAVTAMPNDHREGADVA